MAYSDYGAFVYCNGYRRRDKEDVAVFASDEETFGKSSENIPSGLRIWASLLKRGGEPTTWLGHIHHGIMGDGNIRVVCHKQGLPEIWEATDDGFVEVKYAGDDVDYYYFGTITFEYKGYKFRFISGEPYEAHMTTPDCDKWSCYYDYAYGAGFEDDQDEE